MYEIIKKKSTGGITNTIVANEEELKDHLIAMWEHTAFSLIAVIKL